MRSVDVPIVGRRLRVAEHPVTFGSEDRLGCDPNNDMNNHFTIDERAGKPEPDRH